MVGCKLGLDMSFDLLVFPIGTLVGSDLVPRKSTAVRLQLEI